ncbi:PadR family transcriptional regulator (plasmid) [Sinorhizobium meliloti]
MIGKFEELTLGALIKAGPRSHAAKVYGVFEQTQEKVPPFAALYTALDRMAKKGLVSETKDENDPRGKRLFTITGEGRRSLDEAVNATRAIEAFDGAGVFGGVRHA